ncbi:MAG: hypothetical protein V7668_13770, partial [Cereibacter changlensis]
MKRMTFATGATALLMASAAYGQSTTAQGTTMGQSWDAPLADTFFVPGGSMALRTEPEIQSSWASLTEQQQQQVRDDCSAFSTDNASQEAGASGAASGGVSDAVTSGMAGADPETTGAAEGTAAANDPSQPKSGSTENATVAEEDGSTGAGTATLPTGPEASGTGAQTNESAAGATTGSSAGTSGQTTSDTSGGATTGSAAGGS